MANHLASPERSYALTSRRLADNYSRASRRITCRCLSVFNYYRRRSHDRNIPVDYHPDSEAREKKEGERGVERGASRLSSRICVLLRGYRATHTYHRAAHTLLWHVRNKARTHFTPGRTLRSFAREAFSERSGRAAGRSFQLFNGQLDLRHFLYPWRSRDRDPGVNGLIEITQVRWCDGTANGMNDYPASASDSSDNSFDWPACEVKLLKNFYFLYKEWFILLFVI